MYVNVCTYFGKPAIPAVRCVGFFFTLRTIPEKWCRSPWAPMAEAGPAVRMQLQPTCDRSRARARGCRARETAHQGRSFRREPTLCVDQAPSLRSPGHQPRHRCVQLPDRPNSFRSERSMKAALSCRPQSSRLRTGVDFSLSAILGWGPKGNRLRGHAPHGHRKIPSFASALGYDRAVASCVFDVPLIEGLDQLQLLDTLVSGDSVVMGHLGTFGVCNSSVPGRGRMDNLLRAHT